MCEMKEIKGVKKTMLDVEDKFCSIMNTINLFNEPKAVEPINREQLNEFEFFKWTDINENVRAFRKRNRFKEGYLSFIVEMKAGGAFGEHFHDDLIESTEVVSGEMYDTYDKRYYKEGDVAHYDKGQKHTPIATKKTVLHVLFKP